MASLTSLGCAKNFVETEHAAASLLQAGFGLAAEEGSENIRYINTCAFLKSAREEAFAHIREAEEWKKRKKGRFVCVGGCLVAHMGAAELKEKFPLVDLFVGIDDTASTGVLLKKVMEKGANMPEISGTRNFVCSHDTPRLQLTPSHYAYLKISDGCDNRCNYCLIPSIRGRLRSRKAEEIVEEAENLLSSGVKELIVIAQDTSAYGKDLAGKSLLPDLLKKLDGLKGEYLLRLMYLHPAGITDELIMTMKKMKHLVNCLEMPIQHIDDTVLKNMGRKIFEKETRNVLDTLKKNGFALRTTLMTGFPGETQEAFEKLLAFVKEFEFRRLGVFAYSPEKGTPGAKMPSRPSSREGQARRKALLEAQGVLSEKFNRTLLGKETEVIVDFPDGEGSYLGRTIIDAPDIDNLVHIESSGTVLSPGMRIKCLVEKVSKYDLFVRYVPAGNGNTRINDKTGKKQGKGGGK
ncbi:MAG: 30S ribosomal protein S12 methylthiotransferase RimO [Lentisphaeria bacterium]|nr:30S ribosomal protein S12 methylthiotransferase RimO [Lentisphaeria bacterium]